MNIPRNHHYVPQFYLRNFATDAERKKVTTVFKRGNMAIWEQRSIQGLGYERDFYVHYENGVPISVETDINQNVEIPISLSATWRKISSGNTQDLNGSDRGILYALIRHLEARTPHYEATIRQLTDLESSHQNDIPFSDEERSMHQDFRSDPELLKEMLNSMAHSTQWATRNVNNSLLMILRSPIALQTSTTPSIAIPIPYHPNLDLPLPGMEPYQLVLPLNPFTILCMIPGDFGGEFHNVLMEEDVAAGFNRHFLAHFAKFDNVRHLITSRDGLIDDMKWAGFDLVDDTEKKVIFKKDF